MPVFASRLARYPNVSRRSPLSKVVNDDDEAKREGSHTIGGKSNEVIIYSSNHWSIDGYRV
jgi:hypothetical protein